MTLTWKNGSVWTPIGANTLRVQNNGVWTAPIAVKVNNNGVWVDTGYLGLPAPPGTPTGVGSWTSIYGSLTVSWAASAGAPVPDYYRAELWNEAGSTRLLESGNITGTLQHTFSVSDNTKYQVRAVAYLIGAPGVPGAFWKVQMGHADIVTPVYGWGSEQWFDSTTLSINTYTSQYNSTYAIGNVIDGSTSSSSGRWLSGGRTLSGGYYNILDGPESDYWEGFWINSPGGNRKLARIRVYLPNLMYTYIGVRQGGVWQLAGGLTPTALWMTTNPASWNPGDYDIIRHNYVARWDYWVGGVPNQNVNDERGGQSSTKADRYIDVEGQSGATYNLGQIDVICVGVTNLMATDLSGTEYTRGSINELWMSYRDYVIVSYNHDLVYNTTW